GHAALKRVRSEKSKVGAQRVFANGLVTGRERAWNRHQRLRKRGTGEQDSGKKNQRRGFGEFHAQTIAGFDRCGNAGLVSSIAQEGHGAAETRKPPGTRKGARSRRFRCARPRRLARKRIDQPRWAKP